MYADIVKLPTYNESQNIPETNVDEDEEDQSNPSVGHLLLFTSWLGWFIVLISLCATSVYVGLV